MLKLGLIAITLFSVAAFSAPKKPRKPRPPKAGTQHLVECKVNEISRVTLREDDDQPATDKDLDNKVETYTQYQVGGGLVTVKFVVENLFSTTKKTPTDLLEFEEGDEDGPIRVLGPTGKKNDSVLSNLNGQGGALRVEDGGDITLIGDDDGVTFSTLTLTTKSKYTEGVVETKDSSTPDFFAWKDKTVKCQVSEHKAKKE